MGPSYDLMNTLVRGIGKPENAYKRAVAPAMRTVNWAKNQAQQWQKDEPKREAVWGTYLKGIAQNTGSTAADTARTADATENTANGVDALGPILTQEIVHGQVKRAHRTLARMGG